MKQTLVFILVFGAAFALTLLLGRDLFTKPSLSHRPDVEDPRSDPGGLSARRSEDIRRTMLPQEGGDVVRDVPVESGAAAPTTGSIEIVPKTNDGGTPREARLTVFPKAPDPKPQGGGRFVIDDVAPGSYYVGLSADGYLARMPIEVVVQAGVKKRVELVLERGFELAGRVVDDVEQRPIQGATIDFNGITTVISDSYGGFQTPPLADKALEIVTLTHPDFDRNVLLRPVVPERKGITFAMSRGKATLTGRVIPPAGHTAEPKFTVRIISVPMPGHEEVRRERAFKDWQFEIRGVFGGPSVLEVSFPDAGYASRRIEFDVKRDPTIHLDADFTRGGTIDGTYVTPSGIVGNVPIRLVDDQNHPMGEVRTDAKGRFRFLHAAEGEYALRMDARIPPIYTEAFKVEDGKTATITLDGQTGRLK
jgi:hypothetical protein